MFKSGIYCYENLINGHKYVGQSLYLRKRIGRHESNFKKSNWYDTSPRENLPLWLAVKKYGRKCFSVTVLEYCDSDKLDELEIYYIKSLSSHASLGGYNISWGGGTTKGIKATPEARKNMSIAHMGKTHTKDRAEKIGKAHLGTKYKYNSSKFFGVYKKNPSGRLKRHYWVVDIRSKKEGRFCQFFDSEIDAAIGYNNIVIENNLDRPLNIIGA